MTSPILGIDLGTTHSLVGVVDSGFPILLADAGGSRLTPSVVWFPPDGGEPVVGREAWRRRALEPEQTIWSVKRLLGRRPGENHWTPPYPLVQSGSATTGGLRIRAGGRDWTPEEISGLILKQLKQIAEQGLETVITRAVITVPAFFNDAQRQATKRAGELAGLTVERILNEPTAAALAYGLDKLEERSRVAVYDLGGGTFDLSILELRAGVFEVLATHGDTELGGDDVDEKLAAWLWQRLSIHPGAPWEQAPPDTRARLREAAETAKKQLSETDETRVNLPFLTGAVAGEITVTRAALEALAQSLIQRTIRHCRHALHDAKLDPAEIDQVILVGGSTRMTLVRREVAAFFGREPNLSQHPDEAVALGAVIQAGMLSGALRQIILLDVTPLSLGIETFGGLMNVILPRNTTIPAKAGELFTNAVAGQSSMLVRILQGERELARDNWELGRVEVPFPPGPRGSARVGVQFAIDAGGILTVLTRDTATGADTVLEIQNSAVNVDDAKVEDMISASVDHAWEDLHERQWTEAALKSRELLEALEQALPLASPLLSDAERAQIEGAAARLREVEGQEVHDLAALRQSNQQLDDATQTLAVILVEQAMEQWPG